MATAVKEKEVKPAVEGVDVHHMVRAIGAGNATTEFGDEVFGVDAVNEHVRTWLESGYTLHATHYLGTVHAGQAGTPIIGYRVLYIFLK